LKQSVRRVQKIIKTVFSVFSVFAGLLLLSGMYRAEAQEAGSFPVIQTLDVRDPVFKQYVADVDLARRAVFGQNPKTAADYFRIYAYTPAGDEDILRLSARCNIPYAALATLNRISHSDTLKGRILLPSVPGIFIPESPSNDLERLIAGSRDSGGEILTVRTEAGAERFLFFPGADFTPTERTYFFNSAFRFPLRSYRITSPFGVRPSPFTGKPQRHNGLDLAAPAGTDVYAAREGTVAESGSDPVYGLYVVIAHADNWASLYGHLSSASAVPGAKVGRDTVIGKVGSTGQSTGPHLHFELRKNGAAQDPSKLLFKN
jgi:murein DD-endopeptidase MepM/ murein hydrolase activator NlpD